MMIMMTVLEWSVYTATVDRWRISWLLRLHCKTWIAADACVQQHEKSTHVEWDAAT